MTVSLRDNNLYMKAFRYALNIIEVYKSLSKSNENVLSKQLLRFGTSVGANITEANGVISKADFSSKISIGYKECLESKYWLDLLNDSDYISESKHVHLFEQTDELAKIMFAILRTMRIHKTGK
jgi:four helix bundle protein